MRTPAICHPDRPVHGHGLCRLCYFQQYMREYRAAGRHLPNLAKHREAHKHWQRKRRYGLTKERHAEMLIEQGGGCAICRRTNKRLVVDHKGLVVRGLLCDMCNHAIGYLEGWIPEIGPEKFTAYLAT